MHRHDIRRVEGNVGNGNLTQLALSLGYPDATHFSHAIRQITGLRPSDIVAGSRHLSIWNESGLTPA